MTRITIDDLYGLPKSERNELIRQHQKRLRHFRIKGLMNLEKKEKKISNAEYYKNNVTKIKKLKSDWQKDNPEKVKAYQKKHYQKCKEKMDVRNQKWREKNPEKVKGYQKKYRKKKKRLKNGNIQNKNGG